MPWYYAGPESQAFGPISVEELHARRLQGAVQPDTYVIEHTGQASDVMAWRRYADVFPLPPPAPPLPPVATGATIHPRPPVPQPGTPLAGQDLRPDPYYQQMKPTNGWCMGGFVLGLISLFFSWLCGLGLLLALPALLVCIVGLFQVSKNHVQSGKGFAIAGILMSGVTLLIAILFFCLFALPVLRAHQLTVTEQSSNDSQ